MSTSPSTLFESGNNSDEDRRVNLLSSSNLRSTMEVENLENDQRFDSPFPHTEASSFLEEAFASLKVVASPKLNVLLLCGPIALLGSKTGLFGDALCFCLSGLALIPCAERLSFVTEQLAEHTSETQGALLNATFGNAPELLISSAALRSGMYRVVQLALLGSILSNLLFVFGLSCLVGGMQWQVQELTTTSGSSTIGTLLTATMGLVLPAAMKMKAGLVQNDGNDDGEGGSSDLTENDIAFSRFNALVMMIAYVLYLIFQLGSHKDEFDGKDEYPIQNTSRQPRQNSFCHRYCFLMNHCPKKSQNDIRSEIDEACLEPMFEDEETNGIQSLGQVTSLTQRQHSESFQDNIAAPLSDQDTRYLLKRKHSDEMEIESGILMSLRMSLVWLLIVTFFTSVMSDEIVDTIDGFVERSKISEAFTSVIILPFFSNIAAQVSAMIFAYRNKMDLSLGVTVGSALQIALFVMPGCVLIGWAMDRPMTLYYEGYETVCLLLGVLSVSAVLQGGTTNWFVGAFFVAAYFMIAAGFWYGEDEE